MEQPAELAATRRLAEPSEFESDVDVIADEMKEGLVADEVARGEDSMRIAAGITLGNKGETD
jgi:hypothetical protein